MFPSESAKLYAATDPKFKDWKPSQWDAFDIWAARENQRMLLYYPTGEGKSKLALAAMSMNGYSDVVVVAPPKIAASWKQDADILGISILFMSHQRFRMKETKLPRGKPIIVDEFHMLGKHNGLGFKKLARMATVFPALILCSATPNYNDADRCYNVSYVMDPENTTGNFLSWVMNNCTTEPNYFATMPIVTGFKDYDGAADFLSSQPYTAYVEDKAQWDPVDLKVQLDHIPQLKPFDLTGYSRRKHRIMASDMEARHHRKRLVMLNESETRLRDEIALDLVSYMSRQETTKFLLYSWDKTIAKAAYESLALSKYQVNIITGDTVGVAIERAKQIFINIGIPSVLIGTDALATGVDGIDTVCNHLIILDDTTDDSKRRQLIGRVLPRGTLKRDTIVTTVVTIE